MKTKSELSALWSCALRGNSKAFDILHKELYPLVYKCILKSTKDEDAACDLVQDLFVKLWVKRCKIGPIECITQYFLISARSIVINHLRKRSIITISLDENLSTICALSPESVLIEKETDMILIETFQNALMVLPDRQREMLYMKFHKGYSHYEIEAITGIRYQSIANHLYRATIRLRSAMGEGTMPGIYFVLGK